MERLERISATALLAAFRDGSASVEAYVARVIARQELMSNNNYFTVFDPEDLRKMAGDAQVQYGSGNARPLEGLPIAFKDNIAIAGQQNSGATEAFWDRKPKITAEVAKILLDAGAINVGRTNMHELAYGVTSYNTFTGPVRNFYNLDHNTGGSSGGSASVVAADIVPCALGTDTAGSIRIPANACGVIGYRLGTYSWPQNYGLLMTHLRDSVGPMARTMTDIALLDTVVTGVQHSPVENISSIRIGIPRDHYWTNVNAEVLAGCEAFVDRLKRAGFTLVDTAGPDPAKIMAAHETSLHQINWELFKTLQEYIDANNYTDLTLDHVTRQIASPDVKHAFEEVTKSPVTQAQYEHALQKRRELIEEFDQYAKDHSLDAWIFSTIKIPPPKLTTGSTVMHNGKETDLIGITLQNIDTASLCDQPGITIPAGREEKTGVPFGIEIDAPHRSDKRLIDIALAIEQANVIHW